MQTAGHGKIPSFKAMMMLIACGYLDKMSINGMALTGGSS
jgi:hypothetical protein